MEKVLMVTQVIISILLGLLILIQGKDEGFTASSASQSFRITRRGPEKVIFIATVVLGVLFLANAVMFIFVK